MQSSPDLDNSPFFGFFAYSQDKLELLTLPRTQKEQKRTKQSTWNINSLVYKAQDWNPYLANLISNLSC